MRLFSEDSPQYSLPASHAGDAEHNIDHHHLLEKTIRKHHDQFVRSYIFQKGFDEYHNKFANPHPIICIHRALLLRSL